MKTTVINYHSPEYRKMLDLRYKVLREPLGLNFLEKDLQQEKDDVFIACFEDNCIIGCCILTGQSSEAVKIRQMAVSPGWQQKGVGTKVLLFAEQYAREHGYATIVLHARQTAIAFYEKNGYQVVGDGFVEVGIPHVLMQKACK